MKNLSTKDRQITEKEDLLRRIQELEEKNEDLSETAENYSALFENHSSVMLLIDPYDLSILDANKAAIDFYGYSKNHLCKLHLQNISLHSDKEILKEIENAKKENRNHFDFTQKLSNNQIKYVEIRSTPIFSDQTECLFAIVTDVTKRKKAEQKLLQAKKKVEESDKMKTDFLSNMSHEIRTPLNGILGFADMLKNEELSEEEKQQFLTIINNCGNHLLSLVNNLIDLSQIENNQLQINPKPSNVPGIFTKLKTHFENQIQNRKKDIDLLLSPTIDERLEHVFIDSERLEQVLHQFIDNAIKFTDSGFVKFGCKIIDKQIEFYVEDTGIGLSEEDRKEIFKRFIQLDTSSTKKYQGSGLGLAIAKGIIEKMDGNLEVYSEKNIGSTFYFTIPYNRSKKLISHKPTARSINWKNKTILIADDLYEDMQFIEYGLRKTRINIIYAKNGLEAIEKFKNNPVDLIIMDLQMPVFNGFEATKEIRFLDKKVPVIAQTSLSLTEEKELCLEAGCNDFITKPVDINNLITKLGVFFG